MHKHQFVKHIGLPVFGGRRRAWVPRTLTTLPLRAAAPAPPPEMWRCVDCGEQGYEVPA